MIDINELTNYSLADKVDKDGQRLRRTSVGVKDKNKVISHCNECSHSKTAYNTVGKIKGGTAVIFECKHPDMSWMGERSRQTHYVSPIPKWCPIGNFQ